jgi:hypothetical protein
MQKKKMLKWESAAVREKRYDTFNPPPPNSHIPHFPKPCLKARKRC